MGRDRIPDAWAAVLTPDALSSAGRALASVEALRGDALRGTGPEIFPPAGTVYRALDRTPPETVRVVILGQDPYPTPGHADGLAFSVRPDVSPLPRSLGNVFREYGSDLGYAPPSCGDLSPWAGRGILLLNTVLTVPAGTPNGHRRLGWQGLTAGIVRACLDLDAPVVFLLWGRDAQTAFGRAAGPGPLPPGKWTIRSSHPSPLGAGRPCGDTPPFLGSRPFSTAARLLGDRAPDWRLP